MAGVAADNSLNIGTDIKEFSTKDEVKKFVANNLGCVQYSIFFLNESLWYRTSNEYYSSHSVEAISYVVFKNDSELIVDYRSKLFNVDFPLLVLQKTIDENILKSSLMKTKEVLYNINLGELWSYSPDSQLEKQGLKINYIFDLTSISSYTVSFSYSTTSVIPSCRLTFVLCILKSKTSQTPARFPLKTAVI